VSAGVDHPAQVSGVYRQDYHLDLGKALQEGPMTGATDGSMPVGSGSTIYTNVLEILEHKF
jgi:hypothetical protein